MGGGPGSGGGPRRLGAGTAATLVVTSMIGTGVFTTTGLLVRDLGSAAAVLAAWALGGLLALSGALCYAELAAALPESGGEYHLLGRIYHPAVGFAAGFVSLVVGFAAPAAASALAFGHYLRAAVPGAVPGTGPVPAAVGLVVAASLLHAFHVRLGARVLAALALAEVGLIVLFVLAAAGRGEPSRLLAGPGLAAGGVPALGLALLYVSFAYSGWNGAVYVAGEVADPARALPRALVAGTALVTALYLALNALILSAAPAAELAGVVEVGHVAASRLLGPGAGRALSALVALVLASSVGAMLLAGPRVLARMGLDYPRMGALARRSRHGGPAVAVALQSLLSLAMVLTSGFGALLAYVGFTLSLGTALTVLGVIVLRRREPALPRPYRTWGYPVTPVLFLALSAWMVVLALARTPASAWAGLATVAAALPLHAWLRRGAPAAKRR